MSEDRSVSQVTCLHCRKQFRPKILAPKSEHAGLKCPHCKLYMPLDRVDSAASETA